MLRLYNTRTRNVEEFKPARERDVRIYVCGLTPSAEPHLGHARSFLFFDVLRRYLRHLGYNVVYVQNVTDIDDRSIAAATTERLPVFDVVQRHFTSFKRSMQRLGVAEPDMEPRATAFIGPILAMIEKLVEGGFAYVSQDGIYFRVSSFPRYGRLSGKNLEELMVGARIAENEHKNDPLDFALWKFAKPGEPSWSSRWGDGRPGWHIECSAMAHELLGEPLDIHGGGYDLVFPHHENEIAQTESIEKPPMANFWVHGGMLLFEQKKMSKSLGNYEPLEALLDRVDAQAVRLWFLQTGYRKPINFNEEALAGARAGIGRLRKAWRTLFNAAFGDAQNDGRELLATIHEVVWATSDYDDLVARVDEALSDDMNTAAALAALFDGAAKADEYVRRGDARAAAVAFTYALSLVNLFADQKWLEEPKLEIDPRLIEELIERRNRARAQRDFATADKVRDELAAQRVLLHDTRDGTTWSVAE
ncbi:MAG: cysteine--tRNA ligase [Candidatus Eremiobacteraeota bacterium]|nr:cysteine--tRNA ligase [Candidatus Eremiobacteraeota bacterium]